MSVSFDPHGRAIRVRVKLFGPDRTVDLELALDTGATHTVVRHGALVEAGYDADDALDLVVTGTPQGVMEIPRIVVRRLRALGRETLRLPVLAYDLPPEIALDGLLGLDFLRDRRLTLDFRTGWIELT